MTVHKHKLAAVAIKQSDFEDIPQMNRYRRLCAKYRNSNLIQNGTTEDYRNAVVGFMMLEALKVDEVSFASTMRAIFNDSLGNR